MYNGEDAIQTPGVSSPQRAGSSYADFSIQTLVKHFNQYAQIFEKLITNLVQINILAKKHARGWPLALVLL